MKVRSAEDLCQGLRNIDIRLKDRDKKRRETWTICHFLAAICKTPLLEYPLQIERPDRPDFVFSMLSGSTGVEVVEVVPEAMVRTCNYAEGQDIPLIIGIPRFKAGEPRRSRKETEEIAKGTSQGQDLPWTDDSIAQGCIEAMLYFSQQKARKFQKPGFKKYNNNWLLIYENWRPALEDERMAMVTEGFGKQLLNQDWVNPFDRIFVLRIGTVWEFNHQVKPVKYPIPDLWQKV